MKPEKIIVIGLGNPILGDDGIGWAVVDAAKPSLDKLGVVVVCLAEGGLRLMESVEGFDALVLVDAMIDFLKQGEVRPLSLQDIPEPFSGHLGSPHETNFRTALELGRKLGVKMPDRVTIIAIGIQPSFVFRDQMSPEIEQALPLAVEYVLQTVEDWLQS